MNLALYERDIDGAAAVLASWRKPELVGGAGKVVPVSYWQGMIGRAKGDEAKAREAFSQARTAIETQLTGQPNDPMLLATLGLLDAGLSRREEAVREGRRAVELCPLAVDADDGATVLSSLAMIYAWTGDINAAMERLQFLAKTPGGPHFGYLKYDPAWDAVRSDPRFEAMLKSIEPH
jgi:tetratricopeptide (TPR) repeat protein